MEQLCGKLGLPDITKSDQGLSKSMWKRRVKAATKRENEEELQDNILQYSKLDEFNDDGCSEIKEYLKNLSMAEARMKFRLRVKMFPCRMNFPSDPKNKTELFQCSSCSRNIDTQSHILWCEAYSKLREGKSLDNDKDIVAYFQKVLQIRTKMKIMK